MRLLPVSMLRHNYVAKSLTLLMFLTCSGVAPAIAAPAKDMGAMASTDADKVLCDASCATNLGNREKTSSGLEYTIITPGKGESPPVGIQVKPFDTNLRTSMFVRFYHFSRSSCNTWKAAVNCVLLQTPSWASMRMQKQLIA